MNYASTCGALGSRILALISTHPEILTLDSPFALFKVDGFKCEDLQPSLAQACAALAWARREWARGEGGES